MVWGAKHLASFDLELTARGYHCDRSEWYTALTLPTNGTSIAGLLLGRRPAAPQVAVIRDYSGQP